MLVQLSLFLWILIVIYKLALFMIDFVEVSMGVGIEGAGWPVSTPE